ncbi:MAG: hypothetical protein O6952_07660 [Planctomycetota bacterium]|nr:hypothetical protein [Planctomycetota bacterium]
MKAAATGMLLALALGCLSPQRGRTDGAPLDRQWTESDLIADWGRPRRRQAVGGMTRYYYDGRGDYIDFTNGYYVRHGKISDLPPGEQVVIGQSTLVTVRSIHGAPDVVTTLRGTSWRGRGRGSVSPYPVRRAVYTTKGFEFEFQEVGAGNWILISWATFSSSPASLKLP